MFYDSRMVSLISYCGVVLALTFGLISVSPSATYEGQWTNIVLSRVNTTSLDLTGTAVAKGTQLATRVASMPLPLSESTLAHIARAGGMSVLRGGASMVAVIAAMQAAGWVFDNTLGNWIKQLITPPPPVLSGRGCHNPGYGSPDDQMAQTVGYYVVGTFTLVSGTGYCSMPACVGGEVFAGWCTSGYLPNPCYFPAICFKAEVLESETQVLPATDHDIFTDGFLSKPTNAVQIVSDLPGVKFTDSKDMLSPSSIPSLYLPGFGPTLSDYVKALNNSKSVTDIAAKALQDINSLSPTELQTLIDNGIDPHDLVDAINNTSNNLSLTPEQVTALKKYTDSVTKTTTSNSSSPDSGSKTADPSQLNIPTDCDLIPFVCDWLTWFKTWLVTDPPPIPDSVIPIQDLHGFTPMSTDTVGSCPAPYQYSLFGTSYQLSFQPWCDLAVMISYLVIASAWLFASYIVLRVK